LEILEYIEGVVGGLGGRGPAPQFTEAHALMMLILIRDRKIGRKRLSQLLGLGEGSVRSLIKKFTSLGLVKTDRGGCFLTVKGKRVLDDLLEILEAPTPVHLDLIGQGYALVIRGMPSPKDVITIRDNVVRHGGRGALVLYMGADGLIFPESGDLLRNYSQEDEVKLIQRFNLKEGDLLIIGFGGEDPRIISSILAAAIDYIREVGGSRASELSRIDEKE